MSEINTSEFYALQQDETDPLREYRNQFHIPQRPDGSEIIYLAGNSLGLMPKRAREVVNQELNDWTHLAVDAHFAGKTAWYSYHEVFRETGARLVALERYGLLQHQAVRTSRQRCFVVVIESY